MPKIDWGSFAVRISEELLPILKKKKERKGT
jgi:hypothetical protein